MRKKPQTEEEWEHEREYRRRWRAKNIEKVRAYQKKYDNTHKEKAKSYYEKNKEDFFRRAKKSRDKYPEEKKARAAILRATKRGEIKKGHCEICDNEKVDAHHDDYNKPLDVRWLCREHHMQWHAVNKPLRKTEEVYINGKVEK